MSKTLKNIIEFIECTNGLGFHKQGHSLFPVQKFILKMTYGIPLDDTDRCISISETWEGITTHSFTEKEYLSYLYNEGRCSTSYQKYCSELVLVAGRRGGKSLLSQMMISYELYKLLSKNNPQTCYGSSLQVILTSVNLDQSRLFHKGVMGFIKNSPIAQFLEESSKSHATFYTHQDRLEQRDPTLRFQSQSSSVKKGLHGLPTIVAAFDEIAFFKENDARHKLQEVLPSLQSFTPKSPSNPLVEIGPCEGKLLLFSSPYKKEGFFYDRFEKIMSPQTSPLPSLALQIPAWEMNPSIPLDYYKQVHEKTKPERFDSEFGAKFISK